MNSEDPMKFAVVNGHDTLARSGTLEGAHRASRRKPNAAVSSRVVEMNRAGASRGRVPAVLAGNLVVFNKPIGYIPTEVFNAYRTAATQGGAHFDRSFYANVAPLHAAAGVIASLRAAGFEVEMTPELVAALAGPIAAPAIEEPRGRGLVSATLSGQNAVFKGPAYLGDNFNAYVNALTGAKYDGKVNRANFQVAVGIIKRLSDAGFSVDIDPNLIEVLKSFVSQVSEDVSRGKVRAEEIDARLREKGLSLFGFQKEGVAWLAGLHNAMLFDEQGLGKTVQAIVSLPANAPVVVVCPAVAKGVWNLEVSKWRPEFKVTILSGRKSFRWPAPGEIVVTNFDILSDEVGEAPPGTVVIGDEVQKIKAGTKTKMGARFRVLAKAARDSGGRSWGLTGTPLLNRPEELWHILKAFDLAEEAFGSYKQFVWLFDGRPNIVYGRQYGLKWGTPRPEAAEMIRNVSLRRIRKDVLPDLPTKIYQQIPVDLDPNVKKAIDKALRDAGVNVEDIIAAIEAARSGKRDLPPFTELSAARAMLAEAKIPALLEMVEEYEESEEPILVFSAHRAPIDMIGKRPGWAAITGDTKDEKRTEIVADFQAGNLKGVAITIKAGGTAITLTRASTAIYVDKMWTPGDNEQSEDRICRIGQTRGCNIKELVGDHAIDARVYELLAKKRGIIDGSVEASNVIHVAETSFADVDFDALAAQARREAEIADRTAREIAEAREKLASMGKEERERVEKERERERTEERVRRSEEGKTGRARARASKLEDEAAPERRLAANVTERWAEEAITQLAALDPDAAYFRNDVGFSKADGSAGHWLAREIAAGQGLTTGQWRLALSFARRYQGQVGGPPE